MSVRIAALDGAAVPARSREILSRIGKALGMIPNLHKTLAHSPAALEAYVAGVQALASGRLAAAHRERIAVASAGLNRCGYCASAHTMLGQGVGLDEAEMRENLAGRSRDPQGAVVLRLVRELIEKRGLIDAGLLDEVRAQGLGEAEIVEIAAHVGLNWFTNVFNVLAGTEIDFPEVALDCGEAGCGGAR